MKSKGHLLCILFVLLIHFYIGTRILEKSRIVPAGDEVFKICRGRACYETLFWAKEANFSTRIASLLSLDASRGETHPRFYSILQACSWRVLDLFKSRSAELMILTTNAFFSAVLLFSIYGIGSLIAGRNIGLFSALLLSFCPLVFGHSRVAMLDYPLTCLVALSVYLALRTKGFSLLWPSVLLGLACATAQWTKETALLFLLPTLIYYFFKARALGDKASNKKAVLNFSVALGIFLILSALVYLKPLSAALRDIYFAKVFFIRNNPDPLYYFRSFLLEGVGPMVFFVSLPFFISYVMHIREREKVFFVWFFVPLILFSISANKVSRFLLPVLPAYVLIVVSEAFAAGLFGRMKKSCAMVLLSLSLVQYGFINTGYFDMYRKRYGENHQEAGILAVTNESYAPVSSELLDFFIKETAAFQDEPATVIFLFRQGRIMGPLKLYTCLHRATFSIVYPLGGDQALYAVLGPFFKPDDVRRADYVVMTTARDWDPAYVSGLRRAMHEVFSRYQGLFEEAAVFEAPDGNIISVHKRVREPDV